MNLKLKAIAETASNDLIALVADKETEILEAWNVSIGKYRTQANQAYRWTELPSQFQVMTLSL